MKQIIIIRKELKMPIGKSCAQACHASLGSKNKSKWLNTKIWEKTGEKIVILKIYNLDELFEIKNKANTLKIPNFLVVDAGLTEFSEPTITCLGIGPDDDRKIDNLTKKLKLL